MRRALVFISLLLMACRVPYRVRDVTMIAPLSEAMVNGGQMSRDGGVYSDQLMGIQGLEASEGAVLLEIENRSPSTIRILWDDAAYVNREGFSSRVVPGETRVIDVARSQPSTPIPPQAKARLWAISAQQDTLGVAFETADEAEAYCETLRGSAVRLVLPIEGTSGRREYSLRFVVEGVRYSVMQIGRIRDVACQ